MESRHKPLSIFSQGPGQSGLSGKSGISGKKPITHNQYPLILKNNRLNLSVLVEGYRDVGVGVAAHPAAEAPAGGSVEVDLQLRSFSNITDLLRNAFDNAEYGMPRKTLSRAS